MASTHHSSLYSLRLFDSTGEEEYFLKEYSRQVHGNGTAGGSPLTELTLQQFIEYQSVHARASGHLLVSFDCYSFIVGILLALMMVCPALYTYYYKYDQYSFVLRNARKKAAEVELTGAFESHEMDNFKSISRSRVINMQVEEE